MTRAKQGLSRWPTLSLIVAALTAGCAATQESTTPVREPTTSVTIPEKLPVEVDLRIDSELESARATAPAGGESPAEIDVGAPLSASLEDAMRALFEDVRRSGTESEDRLLLHLSPGDPPRIMTGTAPDGQVRIEAVLSVKATLGGGGETLFDTTATGRGTYDAESADPASAVRRAADLAAVDLVGRLAGWFAEQYARQKRAAADAIVKSALYNAATAMESYYSAGNTYAGATVDHLTEHGYRPGGGVTLEIVSAGGNEFLLRAKRANTTSAWWLFDSNTGQLTPSETGEVAPPAGRMHSGSGAFGTETMLTTTRPGGRDMLGVSVAIDGEWLVAGAMADAERGSFAGAAYVYRRHEGAWRQEAKLLGEDPNEQENFGFSAAIDGPILAVSAVFSDVAKKNAGAVYVFERERDRWVRSAILTPRAPNEHDQLGAAVALSGKTLATIVDRSSTSSTADEIHVFHKGSAGWGSENVLRLEPTEVRKYLSVALDGDTIAVGSYVYPFEAAGPADAGSVLVFKKAQNGWRQTAFLRPHDVDPADMFGGSVSISGNTLAVGSPGRDGLSGAVFVYEQRAGDVWMEAARLSPPAGQRETGLGASVALRGDVLVAGADGSGGQGAGGSATVFRRNDGKWGHVATVSASDGKAGDGFGYAVSLSADSVAVGARLVGPGRVYVYE